MIKKLAMRYKFFIVCFVLTLLLTIINKDLGLKSFNIAFSSFKQMLQVVPPIMILLGLLVYQ